MTGRKLKYGAFEDNHARFINSGDDSMNFQHLEEVTRTIMAAVKIDCQILRKLSINLATKRDNIQLIESIKDTEKKITENLKIILTHITTMTSMTRGNSNVRRMDQATVTQLRNEFNNLLEEFDRTANSLKKKLERSVLQQEAQGGNTGHNPFDEGPNPFDEGPNPFDDDNNTQRQMLTNDAQAVRERHEAILELERDITEMRIVMQDIANLIADQGVVIDAVEDHVGRATEHTKLAGRQLQDAKVYQVKSRKKLYWIICIISSVSVCLLVSIIFVIIILSLSLGNK